MMILLNGGFTMVGKNNRQKVVQSNLKKHYKAYKVGKKWVFASIASLAIGAGLFLGSSVISYAATTTGTDVTVTNGENLVSSESTDTQSATNTATSGTATSAQSTSTTSTEATSDTTTDEVTNDSSMNESSTNQAVTANSDTTKDTDAASTDNKIANDVSEKDTTTSTATETTTQAVSTTTQSNNRSQTDVAANNQTAETTATTSTAAKTDATSTSTETDNSSSNTQADTPSETPAKASATVTDATTQSQSDLTPTTAASDVTDDQTDEIAQLQTQLSQKLIDPTADDLASAKTIAAKLYQLTGEAQHITAVADAVSSGVTVTTSANQVGYGTTSADGLWTATVTMAVNHPGDVYSITIPTDLVTLADAGSYKLSYDIFVADTGGTTTFVKNADGSATITDTFSETGNYKQTFTVHVNSNATGVNVPVDQDGQTVQRNVTVTINGVTASTTPITQTITPSLTVKSLTRVQPDATEISAVTTNTDYVYALALNSSSGFADDSGSARVNAAINTGGTTITVPVPIGFTLDSALTSELNAFADKTTITQASAGSDIIVTVPAGSGVYGVDQTPYYLVGSYAENADTTAGTITASDDITATQSTGAATLTATGPTWTETMLGSGDGTETKTIDASIVGHGNTSGNRTQLALNVSAADSPAVINEVTFAVDTTTNQTDAKLTLSIPDGVTATGVQLPTATVLSKTDTYLEGTTDYGYTLTYADGTTSTGNAAAGTTITGDAGKAIRTIVLTPNYLATGASTGYQEVGNTQNDPINILGTLSTTYDDGSAVQVGDTLTFDQQISFGDGDDETFESTNTQTVTQAFGLVSFFIWQGSTAPDGVGYVTVSQGNNGQNVDNIYEPILYFVIPNQTTVTKVVAPQTDLDDGMQISYYQTDTNQTGIKFDYTGTGLYVSTIKSQTYQLFLTNVSDALTGTYSVSLYVTSPTTALRNTTKVADTTLTDGDANAVLAANGTKTWLIHTAQVTRAASLASGNLDAAPAKAGSADTKGDSELDFYTNLMNTTDNVATDTSVAVNLPEVGDDQGSTFTYTLTGPIAVPTNATTSDGDGAGDAIDATVLYSTARYDVSQSAATLDTTGYVSAADVTDWSSIKSVIIEAGDLESNSTTGRIQLAGTAANFADQSGKVGYLQTAFYANGGSAVVSSQTASISLTGTSTVTAQMHYFDDDGNDQTIALTDLTQTLTDNKDTLNTPTLSADDEALIPDGYHLVTDATGAPVITVLNADHGDYGTDEPNDTAVIGAVSRYYFDGDIIQYELVADEVTAKVTYVDDDDNGSTVAQTATAKATAGTTGTYQVDETAYPATYDLALGQATSIAYTLTADNSDAITVHLVHKHAVADPETTSYTVTYAGLPADKTVPAASGTVDWTADQDEVTETITYTPSQTTATVNVPTVAGYTADSGDQVFTFDTTTEPGNQTKVVTYTPTNQSLTVSYVDDVTQQKLTNLGETLSGKTDETNTYSVKVPTGYVLSEGQDATVAYTLEPGDADAITVHLTHGVTHSTATTTRTVNYYLDGTTTPIHDATTQTINWNVSTDDVTGDQVMTAQTSYDAVTAPKVTGYTATPASVDASYPNAIYGSVDQLADSTATVYYQADPQTIDVSYIDDVTKQPITDSADTLNGKTDETGTYTVVVPAGYELSDGQSAEVAYTFEPGDADAITVHLTHELTHDTVITTRTINYWVEGTTTPVQEATTQTITWAVTTDQVTHQQVATAQQPYGEQTAPTVTGYTPLTAQITADYPAPVATPTDSATTIYYQANTVVDPGNGGTGEPGTTPGTTPEATPETTPEVTPATTAETTPGTATMTPENTVATTPENAQTSGTGKTGTTPATTTTESKTSRTPTATASQVTGQSAATAAESTTMTVSTNAAATSETQSVTSDKTTASSTQQASSETTAKTLPQTNEQTPSAWVALGLGILGALSALGVGRRKRDED